MAKIKKGHPRYEWVLQQREKRNKLKKYKKTLRENATFYELEFRKKLRKHKIKHVFQKGLIGGNEKDFCIADFYIPEYNLIIEIDGGYHRTEKQIVRDIMKDKYYKNRGFAVLRIKNENVMNFDVSTLHKHKRVNKIIVLKSKL